MEQTLKVRCCIAGGDPAGMMPGYLLGRAGGAAEGAQVLAGRVDELKSFDDVKLLSVCALPRL